MDIRIVNLILCAVIFVIGILGYARKKKDFILYTGITFGLFGVAHLMDILTVTASMSVLIITIRIIAYLLVIVALFRAIARK